MFDNIQSQFDEWVKSGLEQIGKEINNRYGIPEPNGDFELLHSFSISDSLISQGGITIEEDSWKIEAYDSGISASDSGLFNNKDEKPIRRTKLFTFNEPKDGDCIIACRAWMKTSGMNRSARLCLGYEKESEFLGMRGGKISQFYQTSVFNPQWQEYEVRHCFRKDKYPTNFWLNLDFYQSGIVWIKNIRLLKAPVAIESDL